MDVIINNPPASSTLVPPMVGTYGHAPAYQGYGYGPKGHGGPGFACVLLLILAGVLFVRYQRRRRAWNRGRLVNSPDEARGQHAPREGLFDFLGGPLWGDPALGLARERVARGEITAEEYETIRQALSRE